MNAYKMYNLEKSDQKELADTSEKEQAKNQNAMSLADEMIDDEEVLPAGERKVPEKLEKKNAPPPPPKSLFE